jgi:hypothetical protein
MGNESKQKLVDVAREIMDIVLFSWLERDRAAFRHLHDYDYIVSAKISGSNMFPTFKGFLDPFLANKRSQIMCYGMPSTGILCTGLLNK